MSLDKHLKEFEDWLVYKKYAEKSICNMVPPLKHFNRWLRLQGIRDVHQLTKRKINLFLKHQYYLLNRFGKQNSARTRNHEIWSIKLFIHYLYIHDVLEEDIAKDITYVKTPRLLIPKDILTPRELVKLFSTPDTGTVKGYRDRMVFELLYGGGLRRSEVCHLKVSHVKVKESVLVIEKSGLRKERTIPINSVALTFVQNYLKDIRPQIANVSGVPNLVLSYTGRAIVPNKLNDMLAVHIKKAKLKKKITLHSLRHTYASHMLQAGCPLRHLQELLGHETLSATVRYLQLNIKDLHKEYKKTHPIEVDR